MSAKRNVPKLRKDFTMSKKDEKPDIDQIVSQCDLWEALDLVEEGDLTGEDRDRLVAMVLVHYWQYFDDLDFLVGFDFNDRIIDLALEEDPHSIPDEIVMDLTNNISHDKRLSIADDWEIEEIRHMAKMGDLAHVFLDHVGK